MISFLIVLLSASLCVFDVLYSKNIAKECNTYIGSMTDAVYNGDKDKYEENFEELKSIWQKSKGIMRLLKNENKVEEITELITSLEDRGEPSLEKLRLITAKLNEI